MVIQIIEDTIADIRRWLSFSDRQRFNHELSRVDAYDQMRVCMRWGLR